MARILLIEYDRRVLADTHLLLQGRGFEVFAVLHLHEAIHLATENEFDLIIIGHSIASVVREDFVEELKAKSTGPFLALLQAGEPTVKSCEHNLEAAGRGIFLDMIERMCNKTSMVHAT